MQSKTPDTDLGFLQGRVIDLVVGLSCGLVAVCLGEEMPFCYKNCCECCTYDY